MIWWASFEEEAESSCDRLALLALRTDPNSSEALQTLASVRLSQKRPDEALQLAEQAWGQWKDLDPGKWTLISKVCAERFLD